MATKSDYKSERKVEISRIPLLLWLLSTKIGRPNLAIIHRGKRKFLRFLFYFGYYLNIVTSDFFSLIMWQLWPPPPFIFFPIKKILCIISTSSFFVVTRMQKFAPKKFDIFLNVYLFVYVFKFI